MKIGVVLALSVICVLGSARASGAGTDVVAGQVVALRYNRMVVRTDGHGDLPLVIDSRTLVPPDLASGASVRVDYRTLLDGRHHAERVLPSRPEATKGGADVALFPDRPRAGDIAVARPADREPAPGGSYSDIEHWNPLAVAVGILLSLGVLFARSWRPRERAHS